MSHKVSYVLATVLICSAAFAATDAETNVTYVNMRDFRNRPEIATQYRGALELDRGGDLIKGSISLTPFHRRTHHKHRWGEGLGIGNEWTFSVVSGTFAATELNPQQLTGANNAYSAAITVLPQAHAYGINISYFQDLKRVWQGLYCYANTAFAQDRRRDGLVVTGTDATAVKSYLVKTDYKKGRYSEDTWQTKMGFEDPEIVIGYNFIKNDNAQLSINLGCSFPTGSEPTGELINEPLVGSKHFRAGAGCMGYANLWNGDNKSLKFFVDANFRYAFETTVIAVPRIVGLTPAATSGSNMNWGHLFTLSNGNSIADTYSNNIKLKPGAELDAYAMMTFTMQSFDVDFGYQFFFRQSHIPKTNDAFVAYTIRTPDYTTGTVALTAQNLTRKREQMVLHRFFGGAGVIMKDWKYPCHIGIGGAIDIANMGQIVPETWGIFGKIGINF